MCGIAGIVAGAAPVPDGAVERMVASARHRGPDDARVVELQGCSLGHARLAVIDPAGGEQPMQDEAGEVCLTFNGVIYNFRELRKELERRGHGFRTRSDTEVLLRSFLEWGSGTPDHLKGQFAFAIWDTRTRELFAARDRLGEKPFYWTVSGNGSMIFASELKQLLASGLVRPTLDRDAVDGYLSRLYVDPGRTIYADVHTLPPAHTLQVGAGRVEMACYWAPTFGTAEVAEADAVTRIRDLVESAVERQTVADVPIGAFLSGGLDSATVVGCLASSTSIPVRTFAVGFGDLIDELPYARAVARRYATKHHEVSAAIDVGQMLARMVDVYDEPFADSSNIPMFLIAEFARQHVKVALSGDGGDELFGGYEWYSLLQESETIEGNLPVRLRTAAAIAARIGARAGLPLGSVSEKLGRRAWLADLRRAHPTPIERHLSLASHRASPALSVHRPGIDGAAVPMLAPPQGLEPYDQISWFDVTKYLPGDILVKVDRAALAHGLETRAPFLDVDLVEFVLSLPSDLRLKRGAPKYLLRRACGDLWPDEIMTRSKQGFGAPVWAWIERPDVVVLLDRVLAKGSPLVDLLPGAPAARPALAPQELWTVLCLGLWLERWTPWITIPS